MKLENIPGYPGYYVSKFGKVYSKHSGKWTRLPIKRIWNKKPKMVGLEPYLDRVN